QLGDPLRHLASVTLLGYLEKNDLCGSLRIDEVQEVADAFILDLLLEEVCEVLAQKCLILKSVAEVLGKGAFSRPEESRHPNADPFVRVGRGLGDGSEQLVVLFADAVCSDIFGDLIVNGLLVGLIDLDDLLNLTAQVTL